MQPVMLDETPIFNSEFLARARQRQREEKRQREKEERARRRQEQEEAAARIRAAAKRRDDEDRTRKVLGERQAQLAQRRFKMMIDELWQRSVENEMRERLRGSREFARDIIAEVAERYNVPAAAITGESKTDEMVKIRDQAIAEVKLRRPDMSHSAIGRVFNRHHTTILHALRKMGLV